MTKVTWIVLTAVCPSLLTLLGTVESLLQSVQ